MKRIARSAANDRSLHLAGPSIGCPRELKRFYSWPIPYGVNLAASSWSKSMLRWLLSDVTVWMTVPLASSTIFVIEVLTLKGSMPPPIIIIAVFTPFKFPIRWIWLVIVGAGLKS